MLVVCLVSVFFIVNFYSKSLDSYRMNQRVMQIRRDNALLEEKITQLQERVAYLSTETYVETAAREKLNLVRPGDRSIIIVPAEPAMATVAERPPVPDAPHVLPEFGHLASWFNLFFGPR
jgi:cell division protein FtsB